MSLRQVNKQTKNPFNRCGAARATVFFHKKWFAAKRALPYQNRGSAPRQHITKNKNGRDSSIARGSNNNGYLKRKLQPKLASACGFREKNKNPPGAAVHSRGFRGVERMRQFFSSTADTAPMPAGRVDRAAGRRQRTHGSRAWLCFRLGVLGPCVGHTARPGTDSTVTHLRWTTQSKGQI